MGKIRKICRPRSSGTSSETGAAIVELAFILPVLALLFFSAFEYTRYLKAEHQASLAGRQIANSAYRNCVMGKVNWDNLSPCLQGVLDSYQNYVDAAIPNATLTVAMFQWRPAGSQVERRGEAPATYESISQFKDEVSVGSDFQSRVSSMNADNSKVVIAEVFYSHKALQIPFSGLLFDKDFYFATVY